MDVYHDWRGSRACPYPPECHICKLINRLDQPNAINNQHFVRGNQLPRANLSQPPPETCRLFCSVGECTARRWHEGLFSTCGLWAIEVTGRATQAVTVVRLAISQFTGTDSRTTEKRPFPDVHHPFTNTVSALCGHPVSSVGVGQGSIAGSLQAQFIGIQYIQTFDHHPGDAVL